MSNQLAPQGLLRLSQIIGDPQAVPPIQALIPVKKSTWFKGVNTGRFPKGENLKGGRAKFYRAEVIQNLINSIEGAQK